MSAALTMHYDTFRAPCPLIERSKLYSFHLPFGVCVLKLIQAVTVQPLKNDGKIPLEFAFQLGKILGKQCMQLRLNM